LIIAPVHFNNICKQPILVYIFGQHICDIYIFTDENEISLKSGSSGYRSSV